MQRRSVLKTLSALTLTCAPLAHAQSAFNVNRIWDVIVIGSGLAGLSAAVSARENGAEDVLVLEKSPLIGGHSRVSTGSFSAYVPANCQQYDIRDSAELMADQMFEIGQRAADKNLVDLLARESQSAYDWLESLGVNWNTKPFMAVGAKYTARSYRCRAMLAGFEYVARVNAAAREKGVRFLFNCRAEHLMHTKGTDQVHGIMARYADGTLQMLEARSVIIATGGFTANSQLRQKYNPRILPSLTTTANPFGTGLDNATGDGLIMAQELGAATVDLEHIQLIVYLGGRLLDYVGGDIYLSKNGERFVNEGDTLGNISEALMKQPSQIMWVLTDSQSEKGPSFESKLKNKVTHQCRDLKAVADRIGCSEKTLQKTLDRYNRFVRNGKDEDFAKTLLLQEINKPPYYVGLEKIGVHFCCGGIRFNEKAQVLREAQPPFTNLFVAGEASGGLHGKERMGGASLVDCVVFGRIAGRQAAAVAKSGGA